MRYGFTDFEREMDALLNELARPGRMRNGDMTNDGVVVMSWFGLNAVLLKHPTWRDRYIVRKLRPARRSKRARISVSSNPSHGSASAEKRGRKRLRMVSDAAQTSSSSPESTQPVDLFFENHGSVCLIRAVSEMGQQWLDENVGDENTLMFGDAVVCEPRYVEAIYHGAQSEGLTVRG